MKYWTSDEEQFLKDNYDKFNIYELMQKLNRSMVSVRKKLYNLKLPWKKFTNDEMRQNLRRYVINEQFFKTWSNDMSYILGLWFADGYISRGGSRKTCYTFGISLHDNDSYLLWEILKKMQSDYILHESNTGGTCQNIHIYSKIIYDDIISLGGCERKSLTLTFPKNIPDDLLPDFIRGYFDGDGSVSYHSYWNAYRTTFTCGSEVFLKDLHSKLKIIDPNIQGQIAFHKNDFNGVYNLTFYKHDTLRFAKIIYKDPNDLYLVRKYDKFVNASKNINSEIIK